MCVFGWLHLIYLHEDERFHHYWPPYTDTDWIFQTFNLMSGRGGMDREVIFTVPIAQRTSEDSIQISRTDKIKFPWLHCCPQYMLETSNLVKIRPFGTPNYGQKLSIRFYQLRGHVLRIQVDRYVERIQSTRTLCLLHSIIIIHACIFY